MALHPELIEDAQALTEAGCFSIVLEGIPSAIAAMVTEAIPIPTIGIGAGPHCDGQVLVIHDILGLCEKYSPRFVKRYADIKPVIADAVSRYISEVKGGEFPTEAHSF